MAPNGKPAAGDGQEDRRHDVAKKGLVYQAPGVDAVTVRRDVEYHATDAGALTMDIYYPPGAQGAAPLPAVVFVFGYSDLGVQAFLGCKRAGTRTPASTKRSTVFCPRRCSATCRSPW